MHFDGIVFCIFFVSRLVVLLFSRLASKKISLSFPYLSSLGGAGVVVEFLRSGQAENFARPESKFLLPCAQIPSFLLMTQM